MKEEKPVIALLCCSPSKVVNGTISIMFLVSRRQVSILHLRILTYHTHKLETLTVNVIISVNQLKSLEHYLLSGACNSIRSQIAKLAGYGMAKEIMG